MLKSILASLTWRRVALAVAAIATLAAVGGVFSSNAYQSYKEHRFIEARLKPLLSDLDEFLIEYEKFIKATEYKYIINVGDITPEMVAAVRAWQAEELENYRESLVENHFDGPSGFYEKDEDTFQAEIVEDVKQRERDNEQNIGIAVRRYRSRAIYAERLEERWPDLDKRFTKMATRCENLAVSAPRPGTRKDLLTVSQKIAKIHEYVRTYVQREIREYSPEYNPDQYGGYVPVGDVFGPYNLKDGLFELKRLKNYLLSLA